MKNINSFELRIVTPKSEKVLSIEWLDVKTPTGNFFIGPDHYDLVTILKDRQKFSYKKNGDITPESVDAYGGFLKIEHGKALIVIDI